MIAIYKKEMRTYFTTPLGYVFLAVALFVSAFAFALTTYYSSDPTSNTTSYFTIMIFLMAIFLPILTMRSFSEERRTKTDQLLFTSPLSIFSLVLGKFLASLSMFLIYVLISLINLIPLYANVAASASQPNGALIVGNLMALILVGACFIAIGIFASTLTENSAVAMVITIGILIGLLFIYFINLLINVPVLETIFEWLSIYGRFSSFTYGVFDIASLIYYLSLTGLFLFLSERVFQVRRLG
ncbi:MAG: ABC transporter permease subunit [Clostridia bacterium]|nr:ABC transporter permease subunit [Clostridia bacterium]